MARERRIGVYVCHCGGNISDHVDVHAIARAMAGEPGVVVSRTHTFACSDAAQQEMIEEIREKHLDGLVIASCSPKLHLFTFRGMAERAGLNVYRYVHVNLREQCAWVHAGDRKGATDKGLRLVRAGVAKCALSRPLEPIRIETQPRVLVIGAGAAGMRAALALADMGFAVFLIEREEQAGGWTREIGRMGPDGRSGPEVIAELLERIEAHDNIALYTRAELVEKSGTIGDFQVKIRAAEAGEISLRVGAIILTTGFRPYEPAPGEYGWGRPGVITLKEFRTLLAQAEREGGGLTWQDRPVQSVVFIYCVGSRQAPSETCPRPNTYCSRYCCTAATYSAVWLADLEKTAGRPVNQYHLYRDIRTYGRLEAIYERARAAGALFLRWAPEAPPRVESAGDGLEVRVKDTLAGDEELEIPADLVVLVTGMVPRDNAGLDDVLKTPRSKDGFYNEVHLKLRPVETVIDGVFIAGTAQSPKNLAESVASALAAASKTGGLLRKGYVDLDPLVAVVDPAKCVWCGKCLEACPYGAVERVTCGDKEVAWVAAALCKGEGACVPVCPLDAVEVEGFRDEQMLAMIDASLEESAAP